LPMKVSGLTISSLVKEFSTMNTHNRCLDLILAKASTKWKIIGCDMMASSRQTSSADMEPYFYQMEKFSKDNSWVTWQKVEAASPGRTGLEWRASGVTTS
jgi:hypothetical protein